MSEDIDELKSIICYFCKKPLDEHTNEDTKACFEIFLNGRTEKSG